MDDEGIGKTGLGAAAQAILLVLAPPRHGMQAGGFDEDQEVIVDI
jgi:hypothetical protein